MTSLGTPTQEAKNVAKLVALQPDMLDESPGDVLRLPRSRSGLDGLFKDGDADDRDRGAPPSEP